MSKISPAKYIARCSMGIALIIIAQLIGKAFPAGMIIAGPFSINQLITGSLVNCVLFVEASFAGVSVGMVVAVCSAILARFIGIGPAVAAISPVVAVGNCVLVIVSYLLSKKVFVHLNIPTVCISAAAKCAFLWAAVPALLSSLGTPEKQRAALSIMFSWPQGLTALIGGFLALTILHRIARSKNHTAC